MNNDKTDIMIELKRVPILNETNFTNVWEMLQWYDCEQSILDLFGFALHEKPEVTQ